MNCQYCRNGHNIPSDNPLPCSYCGRRGRGPAIWKDTIQAKDKEISSLKQDKDELQTTINAMLEAKKAYVALFEGKDKEIAGLRAKLGEAVKIIKVLSCGKSSQDEILLTFHDADQFLKSLEGEKKKEGV